MAFKLFRKNDEDENRKGRTDRPASEKAAPVTPAPGGISTAPAADHASGSEQSAGAGQSADQHSGAAQQSSAAQQDSAGQQGRAAGTDADRESSGGVKALQEGGSAPAHQQLPQKDGYAELVALMDRFRVGTLQLDQRGNEMTAVLDPHQKPERKTVVDTESSWFEAVAQLYTAGQRSAQGPWRRAEITLSHPVDGQRTVDVDFTGAQSGQRQHETYVQSVAQGGAAPAASAQPSADQQAPSEQTRTPGQAAQEPAPQDHAAPEQRTADQDATSSSTPGSDAPERSGASAAPVAAAAATGTAAAETGGTSSAAGSEYVDPERAPATDADYETFASAEDPSRPAGTGQEPEVLGTPTSTTDAAPETTSGTARAGDHGSEFLAVEDVDEEPEATDPQASSQDLPERLDDEAAFHGGTTAPDSAPRHASAAVPDSAPTTGAGADVAPSYRAPAEADSVRRPSTTTLADGNLVLTEADVVRRLRDAQKALFGPEGTARDASSVLIRVRTLGTYFDALTHVRRNGFWDQRKTFDLVPEDALRVLELKKESYLEGQGAPIAMMYRFTPGLPPQVSFDYVDEEQFVKYEERLAAQQYVEELRMYPRTGANVPEHMNEALTQWTL